MDTSDPRDDHGAGPGSTGEGTPLPGGPSGPAEPAEPSLTVAQRFILIFTQPRAAFLGLRGDRWAWLWPALLIGLVLSAAPQFVADLHFEKQMRSIDILEDKGLLVPEGAQEARDRLVERKEETSPGRVVLMTALGAGSTVLLRFMLPAALLLLGVRFVMEGRAGYPAVLAAMSYSALPAALREILRTPLQMAKGSLDVTFSPALLTGTDTVGGYALSLLDVFDLWILWLLILGLAQVGPISTKRAAALVLPLWLIFSLVKIGIKASPFGASF